MVENGGHDEEDDNNANLDGDGGNGELASQVLLAALRGRVGLQGDSDGVEGFDEGHEATKDGQDAAGREGREVWDVIEDSAENVVVCEFEQGSKGGRDEAKEISQPV